MKESMHSDPAEHLEHPDVDLARLEFEDLASNRGRLKVFLGAVAGVGKTYTMLQSAHERLAEGIDVVVGYVDAHGRPETEALSRGLTVLPAREAGSIGRSISELDLDLVLARKPELVLVDDLAHMNAPGSRHARRYQDVEELLRAHIDVYTTLNVQNLESLVDLVGRITGIVVHETVPDSVIESADELELIDLPPDELLVRFREGKVHIADQTLVDFFGKGNLLALRELALRSAADWVDARMSRFRRAEAFDRIWPLTERVLVCVGPGSSAVDTVRAGRRLARLLRADWAAVHVEEPRRPRLPKADRDEAAEALRLSEKLGGEAFTLSAEDPVEEILKFAATRNVSRIVVGHPRRSWRLRDMFRRSFFDRMVRRSGDVDVLAVHGEPPEARRRGPSTALVHEIDWAGYVGSAATIAVCTGTAELMSRAFDASNLIMVYLLAVVFVATRWGRGPSLLAAILSVAAFDFFFVPPRFTFVVDEAQYIVTFGVMAVVGVLISELTARVRDQAEIARIRERRTSALYSLNRGLACAESLDATISIVVRHVEEAFEGQAVVFLVKDGELSEMPAAKAASLADDPKERAAARWALEHGQEAGRGTDTLSGAEALYVPMIGGKGPVGVIAVRIPLGTRCLDTGQMHLLETFSAQAALAFEKALRARPGQR